MEGAEEGAVSRGARRWMSGVGVGQQGRGQGPGIWGEAVASESLRGRGRRLRLRCPAPSLAHSWSSVSFRLGPSYHLSPASVVPIGESCGNQGAPKTVAEAGAGGGAGSTDVTADP